MQSSTDAHSMSKRFVYRRKVVEQYRKLPKRKRRTCRESRMINCNRRSTTSPFCNAAQLITQVAVINGKTSSIVYNVHPNFVSNIFHPGSNHTPQRILENSILWLTALKEATSSSRNMSICNSDKKHWRKIKIRLFVSFIYLIARNAADIYWVDVTLNSSVE